MEKDVIGRTEGLRRQAQEIIEKAYCRGYKDGEADAEERHKEQKKEDELVPLHCPFCGKAPSVNQAMISELWHVMCDHCGASSTGKTTCAEAIEVWNRRANDGCTD